ncbi:autotransporter outer membrane beta-barrel domain-containing protein [Shigella flexneri]
MTSWAQYSWFKNSVKGDELAYESYSAKGATVSLEAGYGFALTNPLVWKRRNLRGSSSHRHRLSGWASIMMRTRSQWLTY